MLSRQSLPVAIIILAVAFVTPTAGAQGFGARAPGAGGGAAPELPNDPATVVAVVGQSPVLLGDLLPKIDARIQETLEKAGQEVPEEQLKVFRVTLVRQLLAQTIQNKMMREAFLIDQVGTAGADKRREADDKLTARARMMFFDSELPELMKQYKTEDRSELDNLLRENGSSLASRQREFVDQMLGHLYISRNVNREPNVSISEINEYYQINREDYYRPTRARWEQMSVMFSRFPSKDDAYAAISEMGREAYFGGNLQAVARDKSQEPFASKGGLHDWTTKGSLASPKLDQQVFSIPTNAMSEIIEDADGFHIIRVLDRVEAGVQSLSEVQDKIRTKLREEKIDKSQREVLESMQHRIAIWSLFPDDVPGAQPMPTRIAARK